MMTDLDTRTKRFVIAYAKFTESFVDMAPQWAQDRLDQLGMGEKLPALKDIPSEEVISYTRAHSNTVLMIEYLRRISSGTAAAPVLTPEFAKSIADALQLGFKERKFTAIDSGYLSGLYANIQAMLDAGDLDAENLAVTLGATMNKKAVAAKIIAAHLLGVTQSAIDGLLYPRAGRKKRG